MVRTCIDSTLKELAGLESDPRMFSSMRNQIQKLQLELKFLKIFIWCLAKWNGANKNISFRSSLKTSIEVSLRRTRPRLNTAAAKALQGANSTDWDHLAYGLLKKVKQFKQTIKATCLDLLDCSLQCKSSYDCYEVFEFAESIRKNLNDLVSLRADQMIFAMKEQIRILEKMLRMYRNCSNLDTKPWINHEEFKDLNIQIQSWTCNAACLSLLYWIDSKEEKVVLRMNHALVDMIRKATPGGLEVAMYFGVLKASKASQPNIFLVAELVNDDTETLHDGLIFLVSLLIHPPEEWNLISPQVDDIVKEAASLISSYCFGGVKENIAEENHVLLSDFLGKFKMIKAKVRQLHFQTPHSSLLDFPKTNGLVFMDFFLRNLEEKLKFESIPFAKHQMLAVHEGLMIIMPILKDILQLQNKCTEIKDLWKRLIDIAYQAEHVIDSFSVDHSPIWCNMIRLSNVIEEIESITIEVKKVKDITAEMNFSQDISVEAKSTSAIDELFVGFKDEEKELIDRLTSAAIERDIISIVGMPGLGKTSLAKKVYDSPLVQSQFHKRAWCCVSQFYKRRHLFSAILKDVDSSVGAIEMKSDEELEQLLYKSLKGRRYLIVMDDIWDIDAWEELQRSFPNDRNGSRIMFTSRIKDVALQANPSSSLHFLRSFSDEECWELLRKKLFHTDDCPPNFLGVGMQIARKCRGLPLAVVVIAGLLAKAVENLVWWRQIEESVGSHIASSSCTDILELSYNHLPDYLKPCFLYLGAFQEDQVIDAKTLTLLWIAEGFLLNPGSKSLEEVAQDYLTELVSRNLVLVSSKNSIGRIKGCLVHDLIREVCLKKAKEENFMELVYEDDIKAKPIGSYPIRYDKYRLGIHAHPSSFVDSSATSPCVRSIIFPFGDAIFTFSNPIDLYNNFKFLKVLHLWFQFSSPKQFKSLPIELTSLVHLRYLAVWCWIKSIPPSIANLKNLETFRLRNHSDLEIELPNTIWKMRRLTHVNIEIASISTREDIFELSDQPGNTEFYCASISSGDDDIPRDSNQLDNIESFSTFVLCHEGDLEKLLRRIPRVRKLKFKISESWDNQFSMLGSLSKLEALSLLYERVLYDPYFDIYANNERYEPYPYAISLPSSLKKLSLSCLHRPWKDISVIGKLPNLEVLKLRAAFTGQRWDVEDEEFLNLKCLKLQDLDVEQWNASSDPFPCLQQLIMQFCVMLDEIPSSFGAISTLKMIHVHYCSEDATSSARKIVQEQLDLGNRDLEVDIKE